MLEAMLITGVFIYLGYRFVRWIFRGLIGVLPVETQYTIRRVGHFVLALIALSILLGGFR